MNKNFKACLSGFVVYLVVYFILMLPGKLLGLVECVYVSTYTGFWCGLSLELVFLAPLISGLLVGYVTRQHAILNGFIVGLSGGIVAYHVNYWDITAFVDTLDLSSSYFYQEMIHYFVNYILYCPLASVFAYVSFKR